MSPVSLIAGLALALCGQAEATFTRHFGGEYYFMKDFSLLELVKSFRDRFNLGTCSIFADVTCYCIIARYCTCE